TAAPTPGRPACGPNTTPTTTPPSCATPTATRSRRSASGRSDLGAKRVTMRRGVAPGCLAEHPNLRYNVRMNKPLKLTKIGDSAGIVLPKELLAHLDVEVGGTLSDAAPPPGAALPRAEP